MPMLTSSVTSVVKLVGNRCSASSLLKIASYKPVGFPYSQKSPYDNESQRHEDVESRSVEFSSSRTRDQSGASIDLKNESYNSHDHSSVADNHVGSYDSRGTISLNSVMQSTVPEPYTTYGKKAPTHLNMPGGQFSRDAKYLSDNLQKTHSKNRGREYHTCTIERKVE